MTRKDNFQQPRHKNISAHQRLMNKEVLGVEWNREIHRKGNPATRGNVLDFEGIMPIEMRETEDCT